MKLFLLTISLVIIAVHCKPLEEPELPHSREFYAGYIKAITDNFDQLFETDRETRSTKDDDSDKTLKYEKRSIVVDEDVDEEKRSIVTMPKKAVIEHELEEEISGDGSGDEEDSDDGSGNQIDNDTDEKIPDEDSQSKGEDNTYEEDKERQVADASINKKVKKRKNSIKSQNKSNYNGYIPQEDEVGVSSRRSEEERASYQGGDGNGDEDIRAASVDMQRASRDQSPEDLAKLSHSTVTFLPTNVRNYKATPYVAKLFHYNPAAIPFGDFPQEQGPRNVQDPYTRQYLPQSDFPPAFSNQRDWAAPVHADVRDQIMKNTNSNANPNAMAAGPPNQALEVSTKKDSCCHCDCHDDCCEPCHHVVLHHCDHHPHHCDCHHCCPCHVEHCHCCQECPCDEHHHCHHHCHECPCHVEHCHCCQECPCHEHHHCHHHCHECPCHECHECNDCCHCHHCRPIHVVEVDHCDCGCGHGGHGGHHGGYIGGY